MASDNETSSKAVLSDGGVATPTPTAGKRVLNGGGVSGVTGILRKSSINYQRRPVAGIGSRYRKPVAKSVASPNTPIAKPTAQDISRTQTNLNHKPAISFVIANKQVTQIKPAQPAKQHMDIANQSWPGEAGVLRNPSNPAAVQPAKVSPTPKPGSNTAKQFDITSKPSVVKTRKMLDPNLASTVNIANDVHIGSQKAVPINEHNKVIQPVNGLQPKLVNKPANSYSRLKFTKVASKPRRINHKFRKDLFADVPSLPIPKHSHIKSIIKKFSSLTNKRKSSYALAFLVAILLIFSLFINIHSFIPTKKIEVEASAEATTGSGEANDNQPGSSAGYSEDQPTAQAVSRYTVAADMPKTIQISSLGVLARVIRVGSDIKTGEIGTPKNVFDTGWYEASAKPGETGAVLIDGLAIGPTKDGIFANLKNIQTGATIILTMGNSTKYTYKVVATEKLDADKVDIAKLLKPYESNKQSLNIMALDGKYSKDTKTYDKRLVVYTVRE